MIRGALAGRRYQVAYAEAFDCDEEFVVVLAVAVLEHWTTSTRRSPPAPDC